MGVRVPARRSDESRVERVAQGFIPPPAFNDDSQANNIGTGYRFVLRTQDSGDLVSQFRVSAHCVDADIR